MSSTHGGGTLNPNIAGPLGVINRDDDNQNSNKSLGVVTG